MAEHKDVSSPASGRNPKQKMTDAEVSFRTHRPMVLVRHPTTVSNTANMAGITAFEKYTAKSAGGGGDSNLDMGLGLADAQMNSISRALCDMIKKQHALGKWSKRINLECSSMVRTIRMAAAFLKMAKTELRDFFIQVKVDQRLCESRKNKPKHFVQPLKHIHLLKEVWTDPIPTTELVDIASLATISGARTLERYTQDQHQEELRQQKGGCSATGFATKLVFGHSLHLSEMLGGERDPPAWAPGAARLQFHHCNTGVSFGWLGKDLFRDGRCFIVKFVNQLPRDYPRALVPCTEHPHLGLAPSIQNSSPQMGVGTRAGAGTGAGAGHGNARGHASASVGTGAGAGGSV